MENKKKSLFTMQIENHKEAHELSIALAMVGITVNILTTDLILEAIKANKEVGDKFDLKTACEIKINHAEKWENIDNSYHEQAQALKTKNR